MTRESVIGLLVGTDLRVRQPRVVVNRGVHKVPADTCVSVPSTLADASEPFDIKVDQVPGSGHS